MRTSIVLIAGLLVLSGCRDLTVVLPDGSVGYSDLACPTTADMVPLLPCKAAQGLLGTSVLCVDFDKTSLTDLTSKQWNFTTAATRCPGWEIKDGLLQITSFGAFGSALTDTCGFNVPTTLPADVNKYQRFTLSIQQRIDLIDNKQQALVYINSDGSSANLMWQATGSKDPTRQQTMIALEKNHPALQGGFTWLFKVSSQLMASVQGWQIESIAVMGTK